MSNETRPLSSFFEGDDWFKFTDDVLDPGKVATILKNQYAPANSPHSTTIEGMQNACNKLIEVNGAALLRALEILK